MKVSPRQCFYLALLALLTALFATGCTTYEQQTVGMSQHWHAANYAVAATQFGNKAREKARSKDAVIWRLEQATALRAAGQLRESCEAFDAAEERIDRYEASAKVKIGREVGAIMSNQANLPYEGRAYDKIMLNTYKALNYLQLGEYEKARVEFNRVYQRQKDAVEESRRRIEKAQLEGDENDRRIAEKSRHNPQFQATLDNVYKRVNTMKVYADYVNPFSVYMDGLFFLTSETDAADLERSSKSFERVKEFTGNAKFIQDDLSLVNDVMAGKQIPPTTYVIFETGIAASRMEVRIDIPIIVTSVSYVGASFPALAFHENYVPRLTIGTGGKNYQTELVASMDSVIASDFKNELPSIISKTLVSSVAKATAAYFVNEEARKNDPMLGLLSNVATAITQMAMNVADTRSWTTLPKEFQVCRIPTPADRRLTLVAGRQRADVTLGDGVVNLVWVKSVTSGSPLQFSQFKLK